MNAPARALREMLDRDELSILPGGCGALYAMIAEQAGFEAFFVAGSQLSSLLYGVPDVGLIGMRDMSTHVAQITRVSKIPVLVDGDTGYGNAVSVHYAVREFIAAGAAGVQFEDQEAPKKSGTGAGRRLISIDEAVGKYRAAVAARDATDRDVVICARTDAIGAEGSSFADALARCRAYVEDGGVDFVWLNSPESLDQIEEACSTIQAPVMSTWGGSGSMPSLDDFSALGLRILMVPTIASSAAAAASWRVLHDLRSRGTVALDEWRSWAAESGWSHAQLGKLIGTQGVHELERRFLPFESQRDYDASSGSMTGQPPRG